LNQLNLLRNNLVANFSITQPQAADFWGARSSQMIDIRRSRQWQRQRLA